MFGAVPSENQRWEKAIQDNGQLFAFIVNRETLTMVSDRLLRILGTCRTDLLGAHITTLLPATTWRSLVAESEKLQGKASHHLVSMHAANEVTIDAALLLWQQAEELGICYYAIGCMLPHSDAMERGNMQQREEMLTFLSHEVRTPASALIGLLELLKNTAPSPEQAPLVKALSDVGTKLYTLLNDVLDFSRVRAGRMMLHMEEFSLQTLMLRLVDTFALLHPKISVRLQYDEALPATCWGDSHRIEQVLTNALANAFKFTPTGSVTLIAKRIGTTEMVRLGVEDTGMGMTPEMLEQLFDPYVSLDAPSSANRGAGLGMHIARLVTELHGGSSHAESKRGGGTRVYFDLPLIGTLPKQQLQLPLLKAEREHLPSLQGAELFDTDRRSSSKQLLLVDDNPINSMVVRKFLQLWGYQHEEAKDGMQAIAQIETKEYGLILMDIRMPVLGGLEATERIRQSCKSWSNVPIIALTASTEGGIRTKMLEAGMDGYIFKPFMAEDLKAIIAHYLGTPPQHPKG